MFADSRVEAYWDVFAKRYRDLGSPLTPSAEDAELMLAPIAEWTALHPGSALRAVLLGVTPGLAQLPLPPGSQLTAIDRSEVMARSVWPGNIPSARSVLCGNWLALPIRDSSCDIVLGDGAMNCLRYPGDFRAAAAEARRVLRPDGLFMLRCFTRPVVEQGPEDIIAELPRHASFHHFKLRLLMALQPNVEHGIPVHDVYRYWSACNVDRVRLVDETGWSRESIDTIEMHRGPNTVHTFPTVAEFRSVLGEFFRQMTVHIPSHSMGESCPTLVFRP